jgi:hypothetical protein
MFGSKEVDGKKDVLQDESNIWNTARVNELLRRVDEEGLDYKEVDNPFHDQNPDLKRANILWEYTPEEIMEIKKCAEDVTYFSQYCQVMTDEGLSYIKLRDYQTSVLREYQSHRFNVFLAPRQVGKCFLPNTNVTSLNLENVPINTLNKSGKKDIFWFIKSFLYKIYGIF